MPKLSSFSLEDLVSFGLSKGDAAVLLLESPDSEVEFAQVEVWDEVSEINGHKPKDVKARLPLGAQYLLVREADGRVSTIQPISDEDDERSLALKGAVEDRNRRLLELLATPAVQEFTEEDTSVEDAFMADLEDRVRASLVDESIRPTTSSYEIE